jgi:hypothetical protein
VSAAMKPSAVFVLEPDGTQSPIGDGQEPPAPRGPHV